VPVADVAEVFAVTRTRSGRKYRLALLRARQHPPAQYARSARTWSTCCAASRGGCRHAASYDVIAFNPLADALLGNLRQEPNLARRRFLRVGGYESSSAEEFGHIAVARLRAAADRYHRDEALARLLAELRASSTEFAEIWNTNPVRAPGHRTKTITHPQLGPLRVNCDVLTIPDDQQVVFITADPGTPTAHALRHLVATG
jgi:hypothetical protein